MPIEFSNTNGKHRTIGERQGDEIIFRCGACPDYERRVNLKTGETTCPGTDLPPDWAQMTEFEQLTWAQNQTLHYGQFIPPGLDVPGGYTPN